jgi:chlorobactene glucosyltransferase
MVILPIAIFFILLLISFITIVNTFTFPRLKPGQELSPSPSISVLIPARNEARVIARTVEHLLAQDFAPLEICILDDHSSDGTAEAALQAARGEASGNVPGIARVKIVQGADLPAGWGGKNWACHQLSQVAQGEWLLFTDADVLWQPQALGGLVSAMQSSQADLTTVWPTQHTHTWGERLVVPLMALAILGYLPVLAVHHIPWPVFAAANGQCLLFRRPAYDRVGGHAGVKGSIIEDVSLAKKIKAAGLRLRMMDGAGLVSCRMYQNWTEVRDGYAKNILAGHGNSIFLLTLSALFHWLVFLVPWLWLGLGWLWQGQLQAPWFWQASLPAWPAWLGLPAWPAWLDWPAWPTLLIMLGIGVRALTAAVTRQRVLDAVLLPISVLLMTRIALQSMYWKLKYGGPRWKGRTLT